LLQVACSAKAGQEGIKILVGVKKLAGIGGL